jgi:hypothetical protein
MRMYSYVVARDFGFAPNPFYGNCTLATCKPEIRRTALIGDLVVGTGSAQRNRAGYLTYAMTVTEVLTFDEYWRDPRFDCKHPSMHGSMKQAFGDNIYHRSAPSDSWIQDDSHHSYSDGTPNSFNLANDVKADRVLVSGRFAYFGGDGPKIPPRFRSFNGCDICAGRGYKNQFPAELVREFMTWWQGLGQAGCVGTPLDWTGRG